MRGAKKKKDQKTFHFFSMRIVSKNLIKWFMSMNTSKTMHTVDKNIILKTITVGKVSMHIVDKNLILKTFTVDEIPVHIVYKNVTFENFTVDKISMHFVDKNLNNL